MTGRRGETMVSRREFSELTRVQIPAALHLMHFGGIHIFLIMVRRLWGETPKQIF